MYAANASSKRVAAIMRLLALPGHQKKVKIKASLWFLSFFSLFTFMKMIFHKNTTHILMITFYHCKKLCLYASGNFHNLASSEGLYAPLWVETIPHFLSFNVFAATVSIDNCNMRAQPFVHLLAPKLAQLPV